MELLGGYGTPGFKNKVSKEHQKKLDSFMAMMDSKSWVCNGQDRSLTV